MVSRGDLEQVRGRYLEHRPKYEALGKFVAGVLDLRLKLVAPSAQITHRAKAVDRLIKKAIAKAYADPYEEIRDKAGVRVVVTFADELEPAEECVTGTFYVLGREDKRELVEDQSLAYRGTHFEVALTDEQVGELGDDWFGGKVCEIQLHTQAENLWANVSHELLYKPLAELSARAKRSIYRLVALVEIFDSEVSRARDELRSQGMLELTQTLDVLERSYYEFTARESDRQISYLVLAGLEEHLDQVIYQDALDELREFVEANQTKLVELYESYQSDERSAPLLHQAEALLIFSLLERDPFLLRDAWAQSLWPDLLEELATIWGVAL